MGTSTATLRTLYPEFADTSAYPDATVTIFIDAAASELDVEVWGELFARGALALAAHMMALAKRSSGAAASTESLPGGAVTSMRTGDEAISFGAVGAATASPSEVSLRTTAYGLEYLRLEAKVIGSPLYVI